MQRKKQKEKEKLKFPLKLFIWYFSVRSEENLASSPDSSCILAIGILWTNILVIKSILQLSVAYRKCVHSLSFVFVLRKKRSANFLEFQTLNGVNFLYNTFPLKKSSSNLDSKRSQIHLTTFKKKSRYTWNAEIKHSVSPGWVPHQENKQQRPYIAGGQFCLHLPCLRSYGRKTR